MVVAGPKLIGQYDRVPGLTLRMPQSERYRQLESVHRGTFVPEANASLLLASTYPPSKMTRGRTGTGLGGVGNLTGQNPRRRSSGTVIR